MESIGTLETSRLWWVKVNPEPGFKACRRAKDHAQSEVQKLAFCTSSKASKVSTLPGGLSGQHKASGYIQEVQVHGTIVVQIYGSGFMVRVQPA